VDFFGGEEYYREQLIKDKIKDEYCKNNNLNLIRINDKNLDNFLELISFFLF